MPYLSNSEIQGLSKNLASAVAENRSADARKILERLQTGVNPVEEVIRATKIGQAVAKVRSSDDKGVSQLAKELVRTWKSKVDSQRDAKKKDSPAAIASPSTAAASPAPAKTPGSAAPAPSSSAPPPSTSEGKNKISLDFTHLGDKTRNTCLRLLYDCINSGKGDSLPAYKVATEIEKATFTTIAKGQVNNDYRTKIRSLNLNLKDKKNPTLRENVETGVISAERLIVMTPEEMASDEKKAEREALQLQNLFKAKAAAAQEAETDAFQCGKCHQRKCTYFQKQTRSADEPMTTFVTCTNCLNKWKFC